MTNSIKNLEIKSSMLFDLIFASNTILSCLFFFFWIINLYFLTFAIIIKKINPFTELIIHMGIPSKEVKA